ncbi:MAG: DUF2304 domain-containing protein [Proteobacteria bacterium]|nr:DUF2304 domain-containing protein [Pseudomonadota bacterium]
MTTFQIALLTLAALGAVTSVALLSRQLVGRITGAAVLVLSVVGAIFTVFPNSTTAIAHALGIGRGADLLLYLLVIGTSSGFLVMYVKLRAVRRELTLLVREIAVAKATGTDPDDGARKSQ